MTVPTYCSRFGAAAGAWCGGLRCRAGIGRIVLAVAARAATMGLDWLTMAYWDYGTIIVTFCYVRHGTVECEKAYI